MQVVVELNPLPFESMGCMSLEISFFFGRSQSICCDREGFLYQGIL